MMFMLEIFWGIGIGTGLILLIAGAYEVYEWWKHDNKK